LGNKYNIKTLNTVDTPYLISTIRAANIHTKDNNLALNVLSENLERISNKEQTREELYNAQIAYLAQSKRVIKYYEAEDNINGVKIAQSLTKDDAVMLKKAIDAVRLIEGKGGEKLGIITEDGVIPANILEMLQSVGFTEDLFISYSLDNNKSNPVQGSEGEYFLSILNRKSAEEGSVVEEFISNVYTATSRALTGSVVIDSDKSLSKLNFVNKKENTTFLRQPLTEIKSLAIKEKRLIELNAIILPTETAKIVPPTKVEVEEILESGKPTTEVDDSQDPSARVDDEDYNDVEQSNEKPAEVVDDNTTNMMFHSFYNRLGIPNEVGDPDSYVMLHEFSEGFTDDMQIMQLKDGDKVQHSDIDTFIKLKNIVSLHYDNLSELEKALTNKKADQKIVKFLQVHAGITPTQFVEQIKTGTYTLVSKIYNNTVDNSAFKFMNNPAKKLTEKDIYTRFVLNVKLNDKIWRISLSALPNVKTLDQDVVKKHLSKEAIDRYTAFQTKLKKDLISNQKNEIITPLASLTRKFTGTTQHVDAKRHNVTKAPLTPINVIDLLNPNVTPIPGVFINMVEDNFVSIFSGSNAEIEGEFNKGHGENKKVLKTETIKNMKGKAYVVLSFDNNDQIENPNQFRKVAPLTAKNRNFKTMVKEFLKMHDGESKTAGKDQNILIGRYDGIKLFYDIKELLGMSVGGVNSK